MADTKCLWGTFDEVRPQLEKQFENIPFDPDSGYSAEELGAAADTFLTSNKDMPKVLLKANIYNTILTKGRIAVEPHDMFADKILHDDVLKRLQRRWYLEVEASQLPYEAIWIHTAKSIGNTLTGLDIGHLSPGWTYLLTNGFPGILQKCRDSHEALGESATAEQTAFYDSVELVYTGVLELMRRYIRLAEAKKAECPEQAERLELVAASLRALCEGPPKTFHQALQIVYLTYRLVELEGEHVRSMGLFDRMFYPFYKADLEAGRLTREQAKELIKFYWIKFYADTRGIENGTGFSFAGQLADGSDAVNDLSVLAIEAFGELMTPDPKLSVRFTKDTPDSFMRQVAETIRSGQASYVLTNDEVTIPAQLGRGKTLEDARCHVLSGCYEPVIEGKEIGCNFSVVVNLAKSIEYALYNGIDPLSQTPFGLVTGDPRRMEIFDDFLESYLKQLDYQITRSIECIKSLESKWPQINPSPFLAGTFDNCLLTGRDIGQGGPVYNNTGIVGGFLANAADSLMAIKTLVYDEKRVTMSEFIKILDKDYEGYDRFRQYILNKIPKYGNNVDAVDSLVVKVVDFFASRINGVPNNRGGSFQAAMYTAEYHWTYGKLTGALPDGRKARTSLAPMLNPMIGMDKGSVTDMINSITKIDFGKLPNGSVVGVTLHPSVVSGVDGADIIMSIIKAFFRQGGFALQFNIFSTETLIDAQKHPEKYPTLQVRITGWSVHFVTLNEFEQNIYIEAHKHLV